MIFKRIESLEQIVKRRYYEDDYSHGNGNTVFSYIIVGNGMLYCAW